MDYWRPSAGHAPRDGAFGALRGAAFQDRSHGVKGGGRGGSAAKPSGRLPAYAADPEKSSFPLTGPWRLR